MGSSSTMNIVAVRPPPHNFELGGSQAAPAHPFPLVQVRSSPVLCRSEADAWDPALPAGVRGTPGTGGGGPLGLRDRSPSPAAIGGGSFRGPRERPSGVSLFVSASELVQFRDRSFERTRFPLVTKGCSFLGLFWYKAFLLMFVSVPETCEYADVSRGDSFPFYQIFASHPSPGGRRTGGGTGGREGARGGVNGGPKARWREHDGRGEGGLEGLRT